MRQRSEFLHHHGAAGQLRALLRIADHILDAQSGQMVGRRCERVFANQNSEIWVSTWPLKGIGSGNTTSKADSRSVATISRCSLVHIVDIAHLALVNFFETAQARLKKRCRLRILFHVRALATATIEGRRLWRDRADRSTRMSWKGIVFGALIGLLLTKSAWGAALGAIIGYMLDPGAGVRAASSERRQPRSPVSSFAPPSRSWGYVAKSDGRVSEAEIDAARRLMQELNLNSADINAAIACFRTGKAAGYDAEFGIERLREACGLRYDLLRAFVELQLRAALAGNGISPPARAEYWPGIAERLGLSGLEFAHMEASVRARQSGAPLQGSRPSSGALPCRMLCGARGGRYDQRSRRRQGVSAPDEPASP